MGVGPEVVAADVGVEVVAAGVGAKVVGSGVGAKVVAAGVGGRNGTVTCTELLMSSPNGTAYKITVSDAGALEVTAV